MPGTKSICGEKKAETLVDSLYHIPLFGQLEAEELKCIIKYMNFFEIEAGEILFREGDEGNFFCFVIDGEMDILKESMTGLSVRIATLSRGSSIGEMSIIDNNTRSATVLVRKKATLVTFTKKSFETIVDNFPAIGFKILKGIAQLLSKNLRKTSSQLVEYMFPLY